jgi:hypothetical protein
MSTQDVARDLVAMCKAGQFRESGLKYWADNVISVEPRGDNPETKGKGAVLGKTDWWENAHDVHAVVVEGPYIHGNQFIVRFKIDMTVKANGQRMQLDETALYTERNGKVTEERFFFAE